MNILMSFLEYFEDVLTTKSDISKEHTIFEHSLEWQWEHWLHSWKQTFVQQTAENEQCNLNFAEN